MSKDTSSPIINYFSTQSEPIQARLFQIQSTIQQAYPAAEASIRYGIPAFKLNNEHLYVAAYKNHIGLYPMYGLEHLESELAPYRGKGTKDALHFLHTRPLPLELIARIAQAKAAKE